MSRWPCTGEVWGGAICLCSWAIFCCFFVWPHGSVEWGSRLRACSANWVPARGASFLLAEYRAQNPASAPPRRGFDFSQSGMAGILRSMIRSHLAQTNRYIAELKTDIAREHAI